METEVSKEPSAFIFVVKQPKKTVVQDLRPVCQVAIRGYVVVVYLGGN